MLQELIIAAIALAAAYPAVVLTGRLWARHAFVLHGVVENTAVIVERVGEIVGVLLVSRDKRVKRSGTGYDVFSIIEEPESWSFGKILRKFFLMGGIRLMGFPGDRPKKYLHVATSFREEGGDKRRYVLEKKTSVLDYVPLHNEVESFIVHVSFSDGIRVYLVVLARIKKRNPVLMVISTMHWWEATRQVVAAAANDIALSQSYHGLLGNKRAHIEQILEKLAASETLRECGVSVPSLDFLMVDPAEGEDARALRLAFEGAERAKVLSHIAESLKHHDAAGYAAAMFEALRESDGSVVLVGRDSGFPGLPVLS